MTDQFWDPVKLSIEIAIVSGCVVLVLGLIIGKWMARARFKGKAVMETLFLLPLVLPPTVVGFLLLMLFGRHSVVGQFIEWAFHQPIIFTWWAAVISAVIVAFPLMYQSAKAGFEGVDREVEDAGRVDGAGGFRLFLLITIPLARTSIISGAILSFARALGEFGATLMFAGNIPGKTQTIPTAIYVAIDTGNMRLAWLWVGCMIAISFLMLICVQFSKGKN